MITVLMKLNDNKNHCGSEYCIPGEKWLAWRLGVRVETISRCVQKLKRMGYLWIRQRRPVKGHFMTNIYKIGVELARILYGIAKATKLLLHRMTFNSSIVNKPIDNSSRKKDSGGLRPYPSKDQVGDLTYLSNLSVKFGPQGGEPAAGN